MMLASILPWRECRRHREPKQHCRPKESMLSRESRKLLKGRCANNGGENEVANGGCEETNEKGVTSKPLCLLFTKTEKTPMKRSTYLVLFMLKARKQVSCFSPKHSEAAMLLFHRKIQENRVGQTKRKPL